MKTVKKILMVLVALGLLAAAGCEKPYDYTMQRNRIFVLGRLLVGQTCDVRVIWRQAPDDEAPVAVTADLSEIGGSAEQELLATDNGTWRWTGQVIPDASGERTVSVTAAGSRRWQKAVRKRFPVFNTDKAVAIGAGEHSRLAVKADGTVLTWDINDNGSIELKEVPEGLSDVVAVAATSAQDLWWNPDRCLALKADGTVADWVTDDNDNIIPGEVPEGLSDVVAIAINSGHSLALKADGRVIAWGGNSYGESDVPAGLTDVIAVSAGSLGSFAIRADGTLVYWGYGDVTHQKVIAVSAGCSGCNYVVNEYGDAYLDRSSYIDCYRIPVRAGGGFKAVAAADHGLGLRKNGTVVSWTFAQAMGRHLYVNEGPENILAIAAGGYDDFRLALAEDGTVTDWHDDWYGHRENAVPAELQ